MQRHHINRPLQLRLNGWTKGGKTTVHTGVKPPKRRFSPGDAFELEDGVYQIVYFYRMVEEPHEWFWCLERREGPPRDALGVICRTFTEALGAGQHTPRGVTAMFRDHHEAYQFFVDIPCNGDRSILSNKRLMKLKKVL
jgi:hypothetical protein